MTAPFNRPASILQKLHNLYLATGKEHQYLIDRFVQERFLYRLSTSRYRDRFALKGGLLLTAITDRFYRSTRDVDLLSSVQRDPETIRGLLMDVVKGDVDDGVLFRGNDMKISPIDAQGEGGLRVAMPAIIGRSRARLQVDLGFDDVIVLAQERFEYPVLLEEYPIPNIRAYSRASMIAEKLEAIAFLDEASSRLKDYDDVYEVARHSRFDASILWLAITTTFRHRKTPLERLWPALGNDRAASRESAYKAYRVKLDVREPLQTFATRLDQLRAFTDPLRLYDNDGVSRNWNGVEWKIR